MNIQNNNIINYNSYAKAKPLNMAEKAEKEAGPDSKSTQLAKSTIKNNQTSHFTDSESSKEVTAMVKQVMQQLVKDALISHAAMIRNSHETKGERTESAK